MEDADPTPTPSPDEAFGDQPQETPPQQIVITMKPRTHYEAMFAMDESAEGKEVTMGDLFRALIELQLDTRDLAFSLLQQQGTQMNTLIQLTGGIGGMIQRKLMQDQNAKIIDPSKLRG